MESFDVVTALLHVASNTAPFNGSHALYSVVKFKRGYPLGSMEVPTVAISGFGGNGRRRGLGTEDEWRLPRYALDVLAADPVAASRIYEQLRKAWQADLNAEGAGSEGDVGVGYLRRTGLIKNFAVSEPTPASWDSAGRVRRLTASIQLEFPD